MVTPLSDDGIFGPLFSAALISVLLVVTNFLAGSFAVLVGFDCAGAFAGTIFCTAGFAWTGLVGTTAAGLATTFFTGFAGTAFFAGGFFATGRVTETFDAGFAETFFAAAGLAVFAATGFALVADRAGVLPDAAAPARVTDFVRTGTFAIFARLPGFDLLIAIPKPIL